MFKFVSRASVRSLSLVFLLAVSSASGHAASGKNPKTQCGSASWYDLGGITASGARMNPNAMTAAHRSLSFGSVVRVVNRSNGRSVVVKINDRGPFVKGRIIDVTKAAARKLGFVNAGHTRVCFEKIG